MNKKALAILMRTRMRGNNPIKLSLSPVAQNEVTQMQPSSQRDQAASGFVMHSSSERGNEKPFYSERNQREFERVCESMHSAISMNKIEVLDGILDNFTEGYSSLSQEDRRKLLIILSREYDLDRVQVRELIGQYLGLELPSEKAHFNGSEDEVSLSSFYRIERNLRHVLQPVYEVLFERLNTHPGGLKFLSNLRADIQSILKEENIVSLRALDSYLKEKLSTWLSPATLELHQITWDDPASLLEKIVAYEAVHPISNLLDLKRRLGIGRRCFGYFHPAIPGEPLIFIEVALLKNVAGSIQEVLWDNPPTPECEASCALFYSISSTQTGLSGINLGKFLIKRVITLVKRDMAHISAFATLSPIPGFMQWLLSKLASGEHICGGESSETNSDCSTFTFWENILEPEEEKELMRLPRDTVNGKNGMEVMLILLTSAENKWTNSQDVISVIKPPLMRLCARYLLHEKKRGKALDSVANFHLQNGAMIEQMNWMADNSEKGIHQSGGIMVNYVYKLDHIEEYAQSYFSTGNIHASSHIRRYVEP